jgi:hypothetical protein
MGSSLRCLILGLKAPLTPMAGCCVYRLAMLPNAANAQSRLAPVPTLPGEAFLQPKRWPGSRMGPWNSANPTPGSSSFVFSCSGTGPTFTTALPWPGRSRRFLTLPICTRTRPPDCSRRPCRSERAGRARRAASQRVRKLSARRLQWRNAFPVRMAVRASEVPETAPALRYSGRRDLAFYRAAGRICVPAYRDTVSSIRRLPLSTWDSKASAASAIRPLRTASMMRSCSNNEPCIWATV